ncbi:MAG: polysaccharide deacetylase family protein [Nitrospiraceae bacterium]|nr:polysaccharide deacetylase family protein [Nitrospiraceae bacterium]
MKIFIKKMLNKAGVLNIFNAFTSGKINIFFYHGFTEDRTGTNNALENKFLPIAEFERHLEIYLKYGTPVSLPDVVSGKKIPRNAVVLTIDDGYANNFSLVYPLLKKYNFPATIFLTTGFIDREIFLWTDWLEFIVEGVPSGVERIIEWAGGVSEMNFSRDQTRELSIRDLKLALKKMPLKKIHLVLNGLQNALRIDYRWEKIPQSLYPLTWGQIREMKKTGLVSFGSHTVCHPVLSRCDRETQSFELIDSKRRIEEELGEPCPLFAYPNGKKDDYTRETVDLLKKAGYTHALTTNSGYNMSDSSNPYELKRWGAGQTCAELEYIAAGGPLIVHYPPFTRMRDQVKSGL